MKPLFSIHEGEYLVGEFLEKNTAFSVWVPSKDTGEDLLVVNAEKTSMASLQVKFSKDFLVTHNKPEMFKHILCGGWWSLNASKIRESKADFWVFVLFPFLVPKKASTKRRNLGSNAQFVIIRPTDLYTKLSGSNGERATFHVYLNISRDGARCLQTRGLRKSNSYFIDSLDIEPCRDFSNNLNCWDELESHMALR
jgi:hypothetical protein